MSAPVSALSDTTRKQLARWLEDRLAELGAEQAYVDRTQNSLREAKDRVAELQDQIDNLQRDLAP